MRRVINARLH